MDRNLLKYWRNCLIDADRRRIVIGPEAVRLKRGVCYIDYINDKDTASLFKAARKNKGQGESEKIKVQIAPCFILPEYSDGQTRQAQ